MSNPEYPFAGKTRSVKKRAVEIQKILVTLVHGSAGRHIGQRRRLADHLANDFCGDVLAWAFLGSIDREKFEGYSVQTEMN